MFVVQLVSGYPPPPVLVSKLGSNGVFFCFFRGPVCQSNCVGSGGGGGGGVDTTAVVFADLGVDCSCCVAAAPRVGTWLIFVASLVAPPGRTQQAPTLVPFFSLVRPETVSSGSILRPYVCETIK